MMHRRTSLPLATALLAAAALAGCTPTPEPTPTPTALFASEDEAYAAAEATYREYVDATNAERDGDRESDPDQWLTGKALQSAIDSAAERRSQGVTIQGHTEVISATPNSFNGDSTPTIVVLDLCLDITANRIIDASGADVTPANRVDRVLITATFHASPGTTLIAQTDRPDNFEC